MWGDLTKWRGLKFFATSGLKIGANGFDTGIN